MYMIETIKEPPVITLNGVYQTIRNYDHENSTVIIEYTFNGHLVSKETFYLD